MVTACQTVKKSLSEQIQTIQILMWMVSLMVVKSLSEPIREIQIVMGMESQMVEKYLSEPILPMAIVIKMDSLMDTNSNKVSTHSVLIVMGILYQMIEIHCLILPPISSSPAGLSET